MVAGRGRNRRYWFWPEKEAAAENPDGIWRPYVQRREMEGSVQGDGSERPKEWREIGEIFAKEPITVI